jgi:hypothetical protein
MRQSEELATVEQFLEDPFTPEQKSEAAQLKENLDIVLNEIQSSQKKLDSDFVKLGTMLAEVQTKKYWLEYGFKSYNKFIESVEGKVDKGRSRLYACAAIATQLLPVMSEEELSQVGISKASALASQVKKTGKAPSDDLLSKAKDSKVSVEQFKEELGNHFGGRDEFEKGVYFDLGGVFFSPEERAEFERGVETACKADPPLEYLVNWHDAAAPQKKEILWRWVATFLADQEAEVHAKK